MNENRHWACCGSYTDEYFVPLLKDWNTFNPVSGCEIPVGMVVGGKQEANYG
jgi:hypothetical protein